MGAWTLLAAPAPWRELYPESSWDDVILNCQELAVRHKERCSFCICHLYLFDDCVWGLQQNDVETLLQFFGIEQVFHDYSLEIVYGPQFRMRNQHWNEMSLECVTSDVSYLTCEIQATPPPQSTNTSPFMNCCLQTNVSISLPWSER